MNILVIQIMISLFIFWGSDSVEDEWPDWRGPYRDGTWHETGVITSFKSDQLDVIWSVPVSAGYSGPTVAEGRVYLTDRMNRPQIERVLCFDAADGSMIWKHEYDCEYVGVGYPAGPRASVIVDEDRAYSLGTMGHLFCFDKTNGKVLWARDLNKDYRIRMPVWGIAAAPLIVEDKIIVHIGGSDNACVVAFDKLSGREVWRNLEDDASYAAPILIRQAGKPVVVVWTGQHVAGLDPVTGTRYWAVEMNPLKMIIGISTPVVYKNFIFVSSFYDGSLLVKLDEESLTATRLWYRVGRNERDTDALHCCISTPLIRDGYIYGVDSYGQLRCLDLMTGDRMWEDLTAVTPERWANIHFVQNRDLTYMFNEHGEIIIARLSEEGYDEISRAKLIEPTKEQLNRSGVGVTWAHPAFAYKHVFIRSDTELLCADMSAK